jgi:hypothetical protein
MSGVRGESTAPFQPCKQNAKTDRLCTVTLGAIRVVPFLRENYG